MKTFYIIDTSNEYKGLSIPFKTRSEAYNVLKELQEVYGKLRFYITEKNS